MTLAEMVKLQRDFDSRHGWTPDPAQLDALVDAIADDIVGQSPSLESWLIL